MELKAHPDLYKRTVKGTFWLFSGRLFQQLLGYLKWIVLARFLHPRDFGSFGLVMLLTEIFNTFTQPGFHSSLIQKKESIHPYLNSVWTFGILRGLILCLILWAAAPGWVSFFEGRWEWSEKEILEPKGFLKTIREGRTPLDEDLASRIGTLDLDSRTAAQILTEICRTSDLRAAAEASSIHWSSYARSFFGKQLEAEGLYRVNRLLLEDAYPSFFQRKIVDRPEVIWLIRVFGILLFVGTFENICLLFFQKELRFSRLFWLQSTASLASSLSAICLAIWTRSVWALLGGQAADVLCRLLLGYWVYPYRPQFELDLEKLKPLWTFGKWITLSGILGFLLSHGDDLVVGKMLGVAALGFYGMAYKISNLPTTEITNVLLQVAFPAYSKLQDDPVRLQQAYFKMVSVAAAATFWFSGLIFLCAEDIVLLLLGEKWRPIIPCIRVLSLWGCVRPLGATSGSVFLSRGKPSYQGWTQAVKLILMAALIYPLTRMYGFTGTGMAVLLSAVFVQIPVLWLLAQLLQCSSGRLLRALWVPSAGLIGMFAGGALLTVLFGNDPSGIRLAAVGLGSTVCFAGCLWLADALSERQFYQFFHEQILFLKRAAVHYVHFDGFQKGFADRD
ncbi:MAG: oligosaccharide flippase family protein [Anaerohalosphaeraceae bacterium]